MGCVQSKSAQDPAGGVLPTSVKVANSTKTGVAPGNPANPGNANDPIYLDRADTWGGQRTETPSDNPAAFQIKSEGMHVEALCMLHACIHLSNEMETSCPEATKSPSYYLVF